MTKTTILRATIVATATLISVSAMAQSAGSTGGRGGGGTNDDGGSDSISVLRSYNRTVDQRRRPDKNFQDQCIHRVRTGTATLVFLRRCDDLDGLGN
ncbi:hypothetical protein [Acuticoccus mangrovi]|uniref:Uncharacterized protein n=1 Tax=Acuticoccus mangrovi TaxID=2796142 RepID=A0A934MJM0_9HYPH|nr:hypothetical protein [Acuticoccus mangrovi]MBJ3774689.1 hypothetical protein [Acuticoccus mangrovi]